MKTLYNNLYLLKMVYFINKKRIFLLLSLALIAALKNIISVIFIKFALDCIVVYNSFIYLLLFVVSERIISLLLSYFECLIQWKESPICDNLIRKHIIEAVYSKSLRVELSALDDPNFYDKFNRAIGEAEQRPFLMLTTIESFLTALLTIFSVSTIILILDRKLIFLSIVSSLIGIFINLHISKYSFKKSNATTRAERKMGYVRRVFYLSQYAEEMKTNNYNDLLFSKLESSTNEYYSQIKKYQPTIAFFDIIKNWQLFFINFGAASIFIGRKIISGAIQVTSFTSLIYACTTLSGSLSNLFNVVPQMAQHALFIENLKAILDHKSTMESTKNTQIVQNTSNHSIVFDIVSFRYNSGHEDTLKNISLTIKKGEKIALVGENGAGKSTLVKLILRLYDPQSGSLYLDNIIYKDLDVDSLRRAISVVYQNFQYFAFSIGENVIMRELKGCDDENSIWEALKGSGLDSKVEKLPDKLYTPLTNEFEENGINLSGGESQKLAIARAIYRDSGVLIMDEPSNNLDPLSEHEMYLRMFNMYKDKTLILISHRLYSTKMVDRIYYLEDGAIVESGSHEELIKLNGKYTSLYNVQAGQYAKS